MSRDLISRKEFGTLANRWFDDLWQELDNWVSPSLFKSGVTKQTKFAYPRLNIKNAEGEFIVEAAVPGLTKDDVRVEYSNGLLTVSAASQNQESTEQNGYVVRELHKSSFSRSITVDEEVCDVEKIVAGVENGVLTVKIPKKVLDTAPQKRIIEVK